MSWVSLGTCAHRGVVVARKVDPPLLGVSFITAWPALLILVFTVLAWRANGWRTSHARGVGAYTRSFVRLGCATALALLCGFELAILYNGNNLISNCQIDCSYQYSFVGSSWIWLGNNMVLVTMAVSALVEPADTDRVTVKSLLLRLLPAPGTDGEAVDS